MRDSNAASWFSRGRVHAAAYLGTIRTAPPAPGCCGWRCAQEVQQGPPAWRLSWAAADLAADKAEAIAAAVAAAEAAAGPGSYGSSAAAEACAGWAEVVEALLWDSGTWAASTVHSAAPAVAAAEAEVAGCSGMLQCGAASSGCLEQGQGLEAPGPSGAVPEAGSVYGLAWWVQCVQGWGRGKGGACAVHPVHVVLSWRSGAPPLPPWPRAS